MDNQKQLLLRQKAEALLKQGAREHSVNYVNDIEKLVEELSIYQIELEMQNTEFQLTNEKLAAQQEKYHSLYHNAPIGYLTLNSTGNIYDINNAATQMFGLPIQVFNKTSIFPYLEKNSKKKFTQFFKKVFESNQVEQGDFDFINSSGEVINTKINAQSFFDLNWQKKLCRCAITNITCEKKYQKTINEQNELLNLAFNNERVAWWDWDYESQRVRYSPNKATMLGYTVEEFPTEIYKITELIHPDDYPSTMEKMRDHLLGKIPFYEVTYRIKTKSGDYLYYYDFGRVIERTSEGKPKRINGIVFNIHQQKIVEAALQQARTKAQENIEILKKNEQRFRAIFEQSAVGIAVVNKKQEFISVNTKFCNLLGYTQKELLQLKVEDISHREEAQHNFNHVKNFLMQGNEFFNTEKHYVCKNGELLWTNLSVNVIKDKKGNIDFAIAAIADISQQKQAEFKLINAKKEVEKSEKYFHSIFNETPILFWEEDFSQVVNHLDQLKTQGVNDFSEYFKQNPGAVLECIRSTKILNVNSAVLKTLEFNTKESLFENFGTTLTTNSISSFKLALINLALHKHYFESVTEHKTASGKIKYFYVKSFVPEDYLTDFSRVIVAMLDITQLKEKENSLILAKEKAEDNEKKLIEAHEIAKLGNWELDIENGIFTFTDSFYKIFHTTTQQVGGYKMSIESYANQFVYHEDAAMVAIENQKAILTKDPNFSRYLEHRIKYFDGGIGYISVRFFIQKDENGKTIKTFGVNQDITERKLAEQELLYAKEKAEESNRLKTAFLNNISHEVRTPLNAIVGFSELITKCDQGNEKFSQYSKIINQSSEKLIGIITDIIEISEVSTQQISKKINRFNFIELVIALEKQYLEAARDKNIELIFLKKQEKELYIHSDLNKLKKILTHIVDNAVKFTKKGKIEFFYSIQNNFIQIVISDTGIGIADNMQSVIFEPFRQVETGNTRHFGGNGLGLTLAKAYIELLNGAIFLTSELNKGTNVFITVPINH